ncbi:MAG: hypothetical protein ABI970_03795 [Chloroflexota bacterium]
MSYSASWYIKDEIIYTHYWGVTTPEDLRKCLLETKALMDSSPRSIIHVICDVGDVVVPVPFKDSMQIVREVGPHERAGWNLNIREKSTLVKMGAALGSSIFKLRFRAFSTLEQAIAHLKFFDSAISWDKVIKPAA